MNESLNKILKKCKKLYFGHKFIQIKTFLKHSHYYQYLFVILLFQICYVEPSVILRKYERC